MRIHVASAALTWLALALPGFAQTGASDTKTLQAILAEVRAIHDEIRATETTQILLTELGMQQSVLNRATERVNEARSRLSDNQRDQKVVAGDLARAQDKVSQISDPTEKMHLNEEIDRQKSNIAALKTDEQSRSTTLEEAREQLRTAQDNLDKTENELNAILRQLRPASR
jgi:chromosome segregation ATPase